MPERVDRGAPINSIPRNRTLPDICAGGEVNSPMQSTTEAMLLTATWEPYTMTATAPIGAADPVYSARVAITAAAGDTIEIDRIKMGPTTEVPIPVGMGFVLIGVLLGTGVHASARPGSA